MLDVFGDRCVGEEIFSSWTVAVFVVSQPLYFAQEKFYVVGYGPHARDVFGVGESVVFFYDGSLIGGEVDRLYVGAVFF